MVIKIFQSKRYRQPVFCECICLIMRIINHDPTKEQIKHFVEVQDPIVSHTYEGKENIPVVTDQHNHKMNDPFQKKNHKMMRC